MKFKLLSSPFFRSGKWGTKSFLSKSPKVMQLINGGAGIQLQTIWFWTTGSSFPSLRAAPATLGYPLLPAPLFSPRSGHLWPMERSGPQISMEETNHLEHERGNTARSQSPLSLQHILGCRKRENSSSVLLEPEDWWLWPPLPQATVRFSNSTWLGLFLSLWFSKENGQLNCFKNNMKGFWNSFSFSFFFFWNLWSPSLYQKSLL